MFRGSSTRRSEQAGVLVLACGLFAARPAAAVPAYGDDLRAWVPLSRAPSCSLCHNAADGGAAGADTPFAHALATRGFSSSSQGSLDRALQRMRDDAVD